MGLKKAKCSLSPNNYPHRACIERFEMSVIGMD